MGPSQSGGPNIAIDCYVQICLRSTVKRYRKPAARAHAQNRLFKKVLTNPDALFTLLVRLLYSCVAHQVTVMRHIARRLLFALVFACHAAVTLCGPCLHALPGSSHELGATSKSQHTDHPAQSRRDGADNCLICQFVAQGQLLAEVFTATSFDQMNELVPRVAALSHPVSVPLSSFPRAPPIANFTLS